MFKIIRDVIDHGKLNKKYFFYGGSRQEMNAVEKKMLIEHFDRQPHIRFRLLNDKGVACFYGIMTEEQYKHGINRIGPDPFEPLDRLGLENGCTIIQYKHGKQWRRL